MVIDIDNCEKFFMDLIGDKDQELRDMVIERFRMMREDPAASLQGGLKSALFLCENGIHSFGSIMFGIALGVNVAACSSKENLQ